MKHFLVECDCPTPLAEKSGIFQAESEAEAVAMFKEVNGIVETIHPITVVEAEGPFEDDESEGDQGEPEEQNEDQPEPGKLSERQQIKNYLADHPESTNKQVVEALAALGTVVTSSQVSAARKNV